MKAMNPSLLSNVGLIRNLDLKTYPFVVIFCMTCLCQVALPAWSATEPPRHDEQQASKTGKCAPVSLNGSWLFRFEEHKAMEETEGMSFTPNDVMCVPGCWDVMPAYYLKRGTGLYRRSFYLDQPMKDAVLEIEGMGLRGKFAIDGRDLGEHPYPYAKLEIPVGPLAKGDHEMFAALDNRFDWNSMKLARPYYDFYFYGGFYRSIRLVEKQPKIFVRTLDYRTGKIEVEIEGKRKYTQTIPDFKLWSPESPNLTTIEVEGRQVRFGIRQIEARNGKIYLNGKEIFLKGVNRHDQTPLFGAAVPESQWIMDLQHVKALGGNFIRGAHYQQADRFLDLCDEMGIMVWEESLGWGNGQSYTDPNNIELHDEAFRAAQIKETRDMVRASFNHPSIIVYAFMNECSSEKPECKTLVDELIRTIKAEDSGRLVTFACNRCNDDICNEHTDIIAFNAYPGTIPMVPGEPADLKEKVRKRFTEIVGGFRQRYPDKPIMVSESGVAAVYGWHDAAASISSEELQDEYLTDIFETLWSNPDVVGFAIWQMNDNRTYSRTSVDCTGKTYMGHSQAGIYDLQRRPKKAVETVKEYFSKR
ncbi:MAG: glycoside hydrolase family 2 TIM barrel-domain containing protein [Bacteroidales bacterium]|nr:glycoside hydrolase family 2 TIM barrel-domain containing protein [Bacteroidales bacterium]